MTKRRIGVVCLGGTFDHFHIGHEALLLRAFEVGEKVVIGITSDLFVETLGKRYNIQPYNDRVEAVRCFLRKQGVESRAVFVPLDDSYGPAATDGEIDGIVVSDETAPRTEEINEIRRKRRLQPLQVFHINTVLAKDGKRISSTRIRLGEIDREGHIVAKKD